MFGREAPRLEGPLVELFSGRSLPDTESAEGGIFQNAQKENMCHSCKVPHVKHLALDVTHISGEKVKRQR